MLRRINKTDRFLLSTSNFNQHKIINYHRCWLIIIYKIMYLNNHRNNKFQRRRVVRVRSKGV